MAIASPLSDRIQQFPNWQTFPPVEVAKGELPYPEWIAGTWKATSTLVDMVAPLAPNIITPGFEGNRQYLQQPVQFQVRFAPKETVTNTPIVTVDRTFNGLNIAKAYLGQDAVISVNVDPENPNRQMTRLKGNQQLISTASNYAWEIPAPNQFTATEIDQQIFRRPSSIYLNQVETTTNYRLLPSGNIEADQVTAIFLSPKDPDYFKALGRPVALYRYQLFLEK